MKFETSGELPIICVEYIEEYTSNEWNQNRKMSVNMQPDRFKITRILTNSLEESLSIPTGRCDLAIATHARKMHKKIFVVVHPEVLDND